MGEKRGLRALQAWCRKVTEGYKNVSVTDMSTSWRDGLAFCALIHHFRPDLIDFDSLAKDNILLNNRLAFTVAEQTLGIPALLDAEDMVKYDQPDKLSIATYVSQYYQFFEGRNRGSASNKLSLKRPLTELPFSPQAVPTKVLSKGGHVLRGDKCCICSNHVFILERLMVDSRLYHRTCFVCAKCSTVLKPGAYAASDVLGSYECIECPSREDNTQPENELKKLQETIEDESKNDEKPTSPSSESYPKLKLSNSFVLARSKFFEESLEKSEVTVDEEEKEVAGNAQMKEEDFKSNSSLSDNNRSPTPDDKSADIPIKQPRKMKRLSIDVSNVPKDQNNELASTNSGGSVEIVTKSAMDLPVITSSLLPPLKRMESLESKPIPPPKSISLIRLSASRELGSNAKGVVTSTESYPDKPMRLSLSLNRLSENRTQGLGTSYNDNISSPSSGQLNSNLGKKSSSEQPKSLSSSNSSSLVGLNFSTKPYSSNAELSSTTPVSKLEFKICDEAREEAVQLRGQHDSASINRVKSTALAFENNSTNSSYKSPFAYGSSKWRGSEGSSEKSSFTSRASLEIKKIETEVKEEVKEKIQMEKVTDPKCKTNLQKTLPISVESDAGDTLAENPFERSPETSDIYKMASDKVEDVTASATSKEISLVPMEKSKPKKLLTSNESNSSRDVSAAEQPKDSQKIYPLDLNPFQDEDNEEYPDDLNPFGDDDNNDEKSTVTKSHETSQDLGSLCSSMSGINSSQAYDDNLNPFGDDDEEDQEPMSMQSERSFDISHGSLPSTPSLSSANRSGSSRTLGGHKKRNAPLPPTLWKSHQTHFSDPNLLSSPSSSRKSLRNSPKPPKKLAPRPPKPPPPRSSTPLVPEEQSIEVHSGSESAYSSATQDPINIKAFKEKNNLDVQQSYNSRQSGDFEENEAMPNVDVPTEINIKTSADPVLNTFAYWKKKKRPAPSVPLPPRRQIKMIPIKEIQSELLEIEEKQMDLEQQGRELETTIRESNDAEPTIDEEELILQLFELVNQKNALFRRQAELMYIKRSQSLEQEQADIEYQYRLLMSKPEKLKTEDEQKKEEELLHRLLEVVELRNEIVESMDMDRQRVQDEDLSIQEQLAQRQVIGPVQETAASLVPVPDVSEESPKKKKSKLKFKVKSRDPSKEKKAEKKGKEKKEEADKKDNGDKKDEGSTKWRFHKKEKKKT